MNTRINGIKVYLRSILETDTDQILKIRNSEYVVKNFIYRKGITKKQHLDWLRNKVNTNEVVQFVVCDINTDEIYGSVYIQHIDNTTKSAESGIFLSDKCSGKGIGYESYKLLIDYCFNVLKLHKIRARVLSYNTGSIKLHLKCNFVQEAYFKDELFLDGKYIDEIFFGILNK